MAEYCNRRQKPPPPFGEGCRAGSVVAVPLCRGVSKRGAARHRTAGGGEGEDLMNVFGRQRCRDIRVTTDCDVDTHPFLEVVDGRLLAIDRDLGELIDLE